MHLVLLLLACVASTAIATSSSSLWSFIPSFSLMPFPLAFPLALAGPLSWALPLLIGLKSAGLLGVGLATGGIAGFGLAGLGAVGIKASLANAALLKLAALGVASKAKVAAKAAKAKLAAPPPVIHEAAAKHVQGAGWDHALRYGHPHFGYGFTRTSVQLRRRKRQVTALRDIFAYVSSYDKDGCVQRVLCEVAAEPQLLGERGRNVADFMLSLAADETDAPWMPYRQAAVFGRSLEARGACYDMYKACDKSTESLVEIAKLRLAQVPSTAAAPS